MENVFYGLNSATGSHQPSKEFVHPVYVWMNEPVPQLGKHWCFPHFGWANTKFKLISFPDSQMIEKTFYRDGYGDLLSL